MTNLSGKTALVTGASRGIGAAIVRALAQQGARVIAHYGASKDQAEALAAETGATLLQADLAEPDGAARLADAIGEDIDILVNNAGIAEYLPWGEATAEHIDRQFAINVRAPLLLTQALRDRVREDGRIVFISSVIAKRAFGDGTLVAYAGTKGAVDTLVVQLAGLFGKRRITVNAIAPGAIETDMGAWLREDGAKDQVNAFQAIPRIGQPDDVADAVAFLASHEARWITGQTIQAGGGTLV